MDTTTTIFQTYYGLNANEIVAIMVMIGSVAYHIFGFFSRKKEDAALKYDLKYLRATALSILTSGLAVINVPIAEIGLESIIMGILLGLGSNSVMPKGIKE